MEWERKLVQWRSEGLIDQATAERIQAFEKRQPQQQKLPILLVVGLVFFALAVFSFIAANWQLIPPFAKVGLAVLLMWIFYVLAHFSEKKQIGRPAIFRILGLAMFGASLVVAGQAFHLGTSSNIVPWALLGASLAHFFLWRSTAFTIISFVLGIILLSGASAVGWLEWLSLVAVSLAWFFWSKDALAMVFSWLLLLGSGFLIWSLLDISSPLVPVWTLFALVLLFVAVPKIWQRLLVPLYLVTGAIQLIVYLAMRGESALRFVELSLLESIALLAAGIAVGAFAFVRSRELMWLAPLGLIGLMLFDQSAVALAATAELTALGFLFYAQRRNKPLASGFVYFIVVQFVIYVVYAWERLDMSLFFLIGAILLLGLSGIAWWINRKKEGAVS